MIHISSRIVLMRLIGVVVLSSALAGCIHETSPGTFDETKKSSHLSDDLRLMWETTKLEGQPDPSQGPNPHCSTDRAINAASRVFNTAELVGKSRDEVTVLLGNPKTSSNSIYNFPFYPVAKGTIVYRFDSGNYGWQFNLVMGEDGKVQKVERHWID